MKTGSIRLKLPKLLDRVQPSSTAVLIGTAIVVGAGTGLGAVFFIKLIDLIQRVFFEGGEAKFGFLGKTCARSGVE